MRTLINIGKLILNFARDLVLSGWDTARVILRAPGVVNSGTTVMPYGDLGPQIEKAVSAYAEDVKARAFPTEDEVYR